MKVYFGICVNQGLSSEEEKQYIDKIKEITDSLEDNNYVDGPIISLYSNARYRWGKQVIYSTFHLTKTFYETKLFLERHWIGLDEFKLVDNLPELEGHIERKKCTCGACKTFGENCSDFYHSKWCDINR